MGRGNSQPYQPVTNKELRKNQELPYSTANCWDGHFKKCGEYFVPKQRGRMSTLLETELHAGQDAATN